MKPNILLLHIFISSILSNEKVLLWDLNSTFTTKTPSIQSLLEKIGPRAATWGALNGYTNEEKATKYFYDQLRNIPVENPSQIAKDHHGCNVPPVVQEWMIGRKDYLFVIQAINNLKFSGLLNYGKEFLQGMARYMSPENVVEALRPHANISEILNRLRTDHKLVLIGNISPDGQTELRKKYKEIFDLFGEHVLTSAVIRQTLPCGNTMEDILRRCECSRENALFVTPIDYEKDMGVETLKVDSNNIKKTLEKRGLLRSPLSNFEALKIE